MKKYIFNIAIVLLALASFSSCSDDDDNGGSGGGTPVVRYVRPCDATISDSLLTGGYLGAQIAIIGENLSGVNAIYFNDQKAKLNPNYVTNNAIIVTIPSGIPAEKEDLIKLYTKGDSCYYAFETLVPAPTVNTMTCEYVDEGDIAYIQGLYFIHEDANPLTVTFTGGVEGEIISYDLTNIAVRVPAGAEVGPVQVTSVYGTSESSFYFRDNRNIILDFDTLFPDGGYNHGWHAGSGYSTDGGLTGCGQYLIFTGEMDDDKWDDSKFAYERWTYRQTDADFFDTNNLDNYVLKFEVNIPDVWSAAALQVIFTGASEVWMNWQETSNGGNPNNAYVSDSSYPRALWIPWADTGSYVTDGWITVTISMSDFKYAIDGTNLNKVNGAGHYSGITLFVNGGGVTGTPCTPTFHIDNVRVVEAE
jgi:hypothetical protein